MNVAVRGNIVHWSNAKSYDALPRDSVEYDQLEMKEMNTDPETIPVLKNRSFYLMVAQPRSESLWRAFCMQYGADRDIIGIACTPTTTAKHLLGKKKLHDYLYAICDTLDKNSICSIHVINAKDRLAGHLYDTKQTIGDRRPLEPMVKYDPKEDILRIDFIPNDDPMSNRQFEHSNVVIRRNERGQYVSVTFFDATKQFKIPAPGNMEVTEQK
jgi:uncharacterized protein YuzE